MPETIQNNNDVERRIEAVINSITNYLVLNAYYINNSCIRTKLNALYKTTHPQVQEGFEAIIPDLIEIPRYLFFNHREQTYNAIRGCLRTQYTQAKKQQADWTTQPELADVSLVPGSPFDRRIDRLMVTKDNYALLQRPISTEGADTGTTGYVVSAEAIQNSNIKGNKQELIKQAQAQLEEMKKDPYYLGVPSLMNSYAITKLYGSQGGQYLVNQKGQRRWYEVNSSADNPYGFANNPTTSTIIDWGNNDPYGRTPYHFTDFVLCKYWKRIQNNRMITLRRYPAPILDNLKFQGMDGYNEPGPNDSKTSDSSIGQGSVDDTVAASGSGKKIMFPPMATAVTYFGEGTDNKLNNILKFTTGLEWEEITANVWEVGVTQTPDAESGPGGLSPGLTKFAKMLNVVSGDSNNSAIMNKGQLPPDPYKDGPYENRILGPVNRIDKVKKRKAGLKFTMDGIKLKFHYVARPVGGINPKAVILDIMSNFLVLGSASAVFFGGQHRFMGNPAKYPFIGGNKGMQAWYSGKPLDWGKDTITSFAQQGQAAGSGIIDSLKTFFGSILGNSTPGGSTSAIGDLLTKGATGNIVRNFTSEKSNGQIPYLQGLKALLTGEPVGEWHLTIGNPLNPIALIGNLICTSLEVEFGEELGPDDFPTEIMFTVNLEHGMPRDRDAIESMFNRGMGRIYDLPDKFLGSADLQTKVDKYTERNTGTLKPSVVGFTAGAGQFGGTFGRAQVKQNALAGGVSVWNNLPVRSISGDESIITPNVNLDRSKFQQINWVGLKALK